MVNEEMGEKVDLQCVLFFSVLYQGVCSVLQCALLECSSSNSVSCNVLSPASVLSYSRLFLSMLTFVPPMVFSIFYPDIFANALGVAR